MWPVTRLGTGSLGIVTPHSEEMVRVNDNGEREGVDFATDFLANAEAWKHWLEYLLMQARESGDEKVIERTMGELNMLSIMVASAKGHLDEHPQPGVLVDVTRRFAATPDNSVELCETELAVCGAIVINHDEYKVLLPLLGREGV